MTDRPRPPRILFVDDEQTQFDLVRLLLTRQAKEVEVDFAWGTEEALHRLDAHAYDVVITDLQMPDGDGYDLLRRIREIGQDMPVILHTAKSGAKFRIVAGTMGFHAVFSKFETRDLLAYVLDLLEQRASTDPTRRSASDLPDPGEES